MMLLIDVFDALARFRVSISRIKQWFYAVHLDQKQIFVKK